MNAFIFKLILSACFSLFHQQNFYLNKIATINCWPLLANERFDLFSNSKLIIFFLISWQFVVTWLNLSQRTIGRLIEIIERARVAVKDWPSTMWSRRFLYESKLGIQISIHSCIYVNPTHVQLLTMQTIHIYILQVRFSTRNNIQSSSYMWPFPTYAKLHSWYRP